MSSRARAAGRSFARGAGQTGFAAAGGAIYYGAHALVTPSLYGSDSGNIPKRCWWLPLAGLVVGHVVAKAPKVSAMGLGLAGGATAIGIEQIQMGISIKKNAAASGASAGTSGVGALLEPRDVRQLSGQTGEVDDQVDAGALWSPPNYGHAVAEAAGLSL